MLSFAAGANNSRQIRNVKKVQQPRPGWRKHDSESAAFAATRRLFSRGGNRDGALFARAVPRNESLPPSHGGSVCGGVSLLEVFVHSLPLHHSLHRRDPKHLQTKQRRWRWSATYCKLRI